MKFAGSLRFVNSVWNLKFRFCLFYANEAKCEKYWGLAPEHEVLSNQQLLAFSHRREKSVVNNTAQWLGSLHTQQSNDTREAFTFHI